MSIDRIPALLGQAVNPQDAVRIACKKILAQQFALLCEHEEGTCSGEDIEDLHRMRVATRKMRSCLRHFQDAFDPGEIDPHRQWLRTLGGRLGEVRDIDTCIRTFMKCQETLGRQTSEAVGVITAERRMERETKLNRLRDAIHSNDHQSWKHSFLDFLISTPERDAASQAMRQAAPALLLDDFDRVLRYRKKAWQAAPPQLHNLRIRCKRFRYLSEFLLPLYDTRLTEIITLIMEFQDILGEVQDHHRDHLFLKAEYDRFLQSMTSLVRKQRLNQVIDYLIAVIETNRRLFLSRWRSFVLEENIHRIHYILKNALLR